MSEHEKLETTAAQEATVASEKPAKADKAKSAKSKKDSKPGFFARVGKWLRELKSELKKVQWPTKKQTVNNTVVVIVCVILVGICIWVFDLLSNGVVKALLALVGKGG